MASRTARIAAWSAAGVLGAGTVAGIVGSTVGIAGAAGSGGSTTTQSQPQQNPPPGPPGHHRGGFGLGLGRALYGDVTVERKDGSGTREIHFQRGRLAADATTTTVRVRSRNGTSSTYSLSDQTVIRKDGQKASASELKQGDEVLVIATPDGHALAIRDGRPPRPGRHAGAPNAPAPNSQQPSNSQQPKSSTNGASYGGTTA